MPEDEPRSAVRRRSVIKKRRLAARSGLINNTPRERCIRHLKEWMADGRLRAGAMLPPELQLAEKLKVSRHTVRLALATLRTEGLLIFQNQRWLVDSRVTVKHSVLSDCIAVVVDSGDSPLDFSSVVHSSGHWHFIYLGALSAAREESYDAFMVHPDRVRGTLIPRIITMRPRGAIIISRAFEEDTGRYLGKALRENNIPFVVYGDVGMAKADSQISKEVDTVSSDQIEGSYLLTRWLADQGRKRILRLWQVPWAGERRDLSFLQQRDAGYEQAVREFGLEMLPPLELYDPVPPITLSEAEFVDRSKWLAKHLTPFVKGENPVDAIMTITDGYIGLLSAALKIHGIVPNKDVLMVGYDNTWEDHEKIRRWHPEPPAATIEKKNMEIGRTLLSVLQERIDGKLLDAGERRFIKPELMVLVPGL